MGKPEVKRPLGRSRHRWEDNITMNLQEIGRWVYVLDWSRSGYRQVAGCREHVSEPASSIKFGEFLD
jgi:hypothetical protein